MKGPPSRPNNRPPSLLVGLWWAVLTLLVLRPIAAPETWWELSRGRAVWRGSLTPSDTLLVVNDQPETNWLGGLPLWLSYEVLSGSGLMLMKLGLLAAIGVVVAGFAGPSAPWLVRAGPIVLAIGVSATTADASPAYWDLLGVLMVVGFGRLTRGRGLRIELFACVLCGLVWGNTGPRFLLAVPVLIVDQWIFIRPDSGLPRRNQYRNLILTSLAIVAAGCATPRGFHGIWDSARMLVPQLAVPARQLASSPFSSMLQSDWGGAEFFLATTAIVLIFRRKHEARVLPCADLIEMISTANIRLNQDRTRYKYATWIATAFGGCLVMLGAQNVALIGLWFSLLIAGCESRRAMELRAVPSTRSTRFTWFAGRHPALWMVGLVAGLGGGWLTGATRGVGWGLDSALDERLLRATLQSAKVDGVAWSVDIRSAGMWCWVEDQTPSIHDVASRALLGGRWEAMRRIDDDLRHSRLSRYYRNDGSEGGWWLDLEQRNVRVLLVQAADFELVAALAPTIWQPLCLDSPTIPYGRAGDAAQAPILLQAVMQRDLIEYGNWLYALPESTASQYDRDRWGCTLPTDQSTTALRQARFMHALGLNFAALRILNTLRSKSMSRETAQVLAAVHADQLHQEQIESGGSSAFRVAILATLWSDWSVGRSDFSPQGRSEVDILLRQAARHYCHGDTAAANRLLSASRSAQARLGSALLSHEQGDSERAKRELTVLQAEVSDRAVRQLAGYWLRQLQSTVFSGASDSTNVKQR